MDRLTGLAGKPPTPAPEKLDEPHHSHQVHVDRVEIHVPPFYAEKPALWFAQLESQFALANVTVDATKYHYVVGHLDVVYASEVEDIIVDPPTSNKYDTLKTELIKRLSSSREKKVRKLLLHEELDDQKSFQFLRHHYHLASPEVPEEFLRTIWVGRLPISMQTIIASQMKASLEDSAELDDRLQDIVPVQPHVTMSSITDSQIAELTRQVQSLAATVQRIYRGDERHATGRHGRSRERGRSHTRETRSNSNYKKFPTCWYHAKFGDSAKKCVKSCNFESGSA